MRIVLRLSPVNSVGLSHLASALCASCRQLGPCSALTEGNSSREMVSCLDLGKKVLIVYAHQEPRSFNGALKDVAVAELSRQGCGVTVSDLYALNFEPRATGKDIIGES